MSIRQGQTIVAGMGSINVSGSSSYKGVYSDTMVYNMGDYVNSDINNSVFFMCTQDNVVGKGFKPSYWVRLDNDGLVDFCEETEDSAYYMGLIPGNVSGTNYGGAMRFSPNAPKVNASTGEIIGYAKTEDLPTKVSELENDSGYLTSHQDLTDYALKSELPIVPTNISAFTNDSGYLTSHQDISGKANTSLSNINDAGKSVIDNRIASVIDSELPTIVYWS